MESEATPEVIPPFQTDALLELAGVQVLLGASLTTTEGVSFGEAAQ